MRCVIQTYLSLFFYHFYSLPRAGPNCWYCRHFLKKCFHPSLPTFSKKYFRDLRFAQNFTRVFQTTHMSPIKWCTKMQNIKLSSLKGNDGASVFWACLDMHFDRNLRVSHRLQIMCRDSKQPCLYCWPFCWLFLTIILASQCLKIYNVQWYLPSEIFFLHLSAAQLDALNGAFL